MLTKFVHEKRKSQQLLAQQEEDDDDQQCGGNSTWEEAKNTQAKETENLKLPAASRPEKSYGAAIVNSLGGTWLGLDQEVKKHHNTNTTASQPGLWLDESETNRETYQNVIRGDARSVIGSHQESSADEEDEYSSHEHATVPSASNSNKNLLELLGWSPKCEKVVVTANNDNKASQNRRKSDVGSITAQLKRRPDHTGTRLSKSCTGEPPSSYDQDEIPIDSNNHIKNWFNNFGGGGKKQAEPKASSSCEAGTSITSSLITDEKALAKRPSPHSIMDEFEGPPQLQAPPFLESGSVSAMPQVHRPRSCLKRSSSDINYVSDTSALLDVFDENSDDNKVGAEHLIHMLLSLDSGPPPSKEKAAMSNPSNNHRGAKEEEDPPQKLALSQETTSKFKYKPRSKQIQVNSVAYPPDNTSLIRNPPQKLELSQEPTSGKFQYRPRSKHSRSITTDQQIHKVNAADNTATASLSSSPSPSLMSTGSVNDMRRRHIRKISRRNESFDNVDSNSFKGTTLKKQVPSDVPQHTTTSSSNKGAADVDLLTRYFQNKAKNQAVEDPSSSQLLVNWPSSDDEDVNEHVDDDDTDGITITPHEVASKRMSDLTVDGEEIDEIEQLDPVEIRKHCKRNYSIDSIAECLHEDDSFDNGEQVTPRDNDLVINTGKRSLLHELLNVDGSGL